MSRRRSSAVRPSRNVLQPHRLVPTPHLVPGKTIAAAIRSAALRGVHVDLVVPSEAATGIAQAAGYSYCADLFDVVVRVLEFARGLLHAETLTIDTDFALIGSANFDIHSFMLNFEVALLIYDDDCVSQLRLLRGECRDKSVALSASTGRTRPAIQRVADLVAKLLSPLL